MLSIENIRDKVVPLARKYRAQRVALFGSYADGTATEKSDADFIVEFASTPSIFAVMGLREEISRSLGRPVDLVTLPMPRPERLHFDQVVSIYEQS